MPRYTGREEIINDLEEYETLIEKRGKKEIVQNDFFNFNRSFTKSNFRVKKHTWAQGDKLYKIAGLYYGDIKYWWLIALWNNRPTDADYILGQVVEIPYPISEFYREVTDGD